MSNNWAGAKDLAVFGGKIAIIWVCSRKGRFGKKLSVSDGQEI